jgi:peptide chain release factor 1
VTGAGATALFGNEGGGHRWQRIPPTERSGRVHTSTVTVAVLEPGRVVGNPIARDVDITTARGSGPGGQHRNKTESCVTATHRPTGITVKIDMKSQHQSRSMALAVLAGRLYAMQRNQLLASENDSRKQQVGSGMRGDKIRTYRSQDDRVVDHRTGKRWVLSRWIRGEW